MEAAAKLYEKPQKTYAKEELLRRLKKSTVPQEFLSLWMERGVIWTDEAKTEGQFSRDFRLNGPMLIPSYSSALLKREVLLERYSTPTVRILGRDSEPAQGKIRVPKIRNLLWVCELLCNCVQGL